MATRTSHRWNSRPGSFDTLNCEMIFPGVNRFGIPDLAPYRGDAPEFMLPFNQRVRGDYPLEKAAAHFFFDDYYFERFWNNWRRMPKLVTQVGVTLTPDFSVYSDWPVAAQIWNVYRGRWFGAYWQAQGIEVIPTMTWGDERTYEFCFEGVQPSSVVAIAFAGSGRSREERDRFRGGYVEMCRRLTPSLVLCYGPLPDDLQGVAPVKCYPTRWEQIRRAL